MKKSLIIFILIFMLASCNAQVNVSQPVITSTEEMPVIIETAPEETTVREVITTEEIITEPATTIAEPATEIIEEPAETTIITEQPPPAAVQARNIPVFMYHTSSENNPGGLAELYVKPSEFEKQIKYLDDNGYTFCTFDDWFNLHNIEKPVFITFDDGYESNYTEIFPILQKYNAKITLFLMLNNMAAENFTAEMIREMNDSGLVKFESHTISHPDLAAISGNDAVLTRELEDSKKQIEELTGRPVLALAYPVGRFNARVMERAKEYYLFGVSTIAGKHNTGEHDNFEIRRLRMNRSTSLNAFINMLGG